MKHPATADKTGSLLETSGAGMRAGPTSRETGVAWGGFEREGFHGEVEFKEIARRRR
ncbi:MAG: hypothetical protein LC126_14665 [Bryobacterales bacterium]|nr:hypothetical protein [Bryobacterales bacterium]